MTGQYQTNLKRFQYVTINIRKELSGCAYSQSRYKSVILIENKNSSSQQAY